MRRPLLFVLAAGPGLFVLPHGEADAATRLTAYMCQPLTAENRAMCCSAPNRNDIILPYEQRECERVDRQRERSLAARRTNNPQTGDDDDDDDDGLGNPGNAKHVGRAGEKADKGMFSESSGPKGIKGQSENHGP